MNLAPLRSTWLQYRHAVVFFAALAILAALACAEDANKQLTRPSDAVLFRGKYYRVYVDDCGWKTAQSKCQRLGGKLATVPDKETHQFLTKLANGRKLFIGATNSQAGVWKWVDGTPVKSFQPWERGQPNDLKGREHYLAMGRTGNWFDIAESSDWSQGYICEWVAARR